MCQCSEWLASGNAPCPCSDLALYCASRVVARQDLGNVGPKNLSFLPVLQEFTTCPTRLTVAIDRGATVVHICPRILPRRASFPEKRVHQLDVVRHGQKALGDVKYCVKRQLAPHLYEEE